ncbi:serum response factor-binding protein 1 isoform X1 [Anguilla anguilla]|uniref:serum response factor-binding protein 1 isoform X1 n=1 Tax=Anguilla anguilla TaxID=7936 RepID=UPI0015ACE8A2|nr:serum response factor-binding protein 1 isoform X1 [Anguilla anguilla]XP_035283700.1 serum response factor-binding protein 1 isoform X2 [Anguilla anguilla]XP_035283701.1 serum response factor-binding protein 1 isoform X1 [Anguilla anguilla]
MLNRLPSFVKSSKPTSKMAEVLNLNNEVVKMRKEIKRARVLIIRKLTRQIVKLKKKKGKEAEVEKNQRRAARLLEEIHAMKDLKPDNVTKIALMKNLSFEKVCKNPDSTLSERATARIATHPQISKRIQEIKAAVEAFKDERKKPAGSKASKPDKPAEDPKMDEVKSDDSEEDEEDKKEKEEEEEEEEEEKKKKEEEEEEEVEEEDDDDDRDDGDDGGDVEDKGEQKEEGLGAAKDSSSPTAEEGPTVKMDDDIKVTASKSELMGPPEEAEVQPEEKAQTLIKPQKSLETAFKLEDSKTPHTKDKRIQKPTENKPPPQSQSNSKMEIKSSTAKGEKKEEESDLDSSDDEEEKEYFDDSTEERFRKQSSQSEGSDEEDDFFLGKVSKFKKRRTGPGVGEVKKGDGDRNVSRAGAPKGEAEGGCGGEGSGLQDSKAMRMESVFCSTLSGSKGAPGNRGRGPSAISKPHRFQNDRRGQTWTQKSAPFQNRGGGQDRKPMSRFQNQRRGGPRGGPQVQDRGPAAARARPPFEKPRDHRAAPGRASNPSQHTQQALHPSWEASKRRKEQQAQITAFQGKKIKFDDD